MFLFIRCKNVKLVNEDNALRSIRIVRHSNEYGIEWILNIEPSYNFSDKKYEVHIGQAICRARILAESCTDPDGQLKIRLSLPSVPGLLAKLWYVLHLTHGRDIAVSIFDNGTEAATPGGISTATSSDPPSSSSIAPFPAVVSSYQKSLLLLTGSILPKHLEATITGEENDLNLGVRTTTLYPPIYLKEYWGEITNSRKYGRFDSVMYQIAISNPVVPELIKKARNNHLHSSSSNWCLIYSHNMPNKDEILLAVDPLIKFRNGSTLELTDGLAPNVILDLLDNLMSSTIENRPYYFLIIGGFDIMSIELQYILQSIGAAGRIAFSMPEEYSSYAKKVINFEENIVSTTNQQDKEDFFVIGRPAYIASDYDDVNTINYNQIVEPLLSALDLPPPGELLSKGRADKERVLEVLRRTSKYGILFFSAHGFEHTDSSRYQSENIYYDMLEFQGSLILDEFISDRGLASSKGLLSTADVNRIPVAPGGIAIFHSCYSAGTVDRDTMPEWIHLDMPDRVLPRKPFVNKLAQALLSNPEGPVALYAHINRSFQYDYYHPSNKKESSTYLQYYRIIKELLNGETLGISRETTRKYSLDYTYQVMTLSYQIEALLTGIYRGDVGWMTNSRRE